jgi:hypothetical protein
MRGDVVTHFVKVTSMGPRCLFVVSVLGAEKPGTREPCAPATTGRSRIAIARETTRLGTPMIFIRLLSLTVVSAC